MTDLRGRFNRLEAGARYVALLHLRPACLDLAAATAGDLAAAARFKGWRCAPDSTPRRQRRPAPLRYHNGAIAPARTAAKYVNPVTTATPNPTMQNRNASATPWVVTLGRGADGGAAGATWWAARTSASWRWASRSSRRSARTSAA